MEFLIICWVMCGFQFLSIWRGITTKEKSDKAGRQKIGRRLFCTMGIPAIISIIISFIFIFVWKSYSWATIFILVIMDVIMLYNGSSLENKIFKNTNKKENKKK